MSLMIELPRYRNAVGDLVHAIQIEHVIENPRGQEAHFVGKRYVPIVLPFAVKPGGYMMIENGAKCFMPAEEFERYYTPDATAMPPLLVDEV